MPLPAFSRTDPLLESGEVKQLPAAERPKSKRERAGHPRRRSAFIAWRSRAALAHRWLGLFMALFLIVAGLTGCLLAFERELDRWLNPQLFTVAHTGPPLSPEALLVRIAAQAPCAEVSMLPVRVAPGQALQLGVRARRMSGDEPPCRFDANQMFVDPSSGRILGMRKSGTPRFDREHLLPFIVKLHYSLHLPERWGNWLMGGIALAWIVDSLLALTLTLPRGRPFWRKWRTSWGIQRRRLNFDLHRAAGLWFGLLLLVLAISGVYLNLYSEIFKPAVNALSPLTPTPFETRPVRPVTAAAYDYDSFLVHAAAQGAALGIAAPLAAVGRRADRGFYVAVYRDGTDGNDPGLGNTRLYFDDRNGALIGQFRPGEGTAGDLFMQLQLPLHSGRIAGLPGRIAIALSGLATALLAVTGLLIRWRKRQGRHGLEAARLQSRHGRYPI